MSAVESFGYVNRLATLVGTSDAALRLLLSILLGYPLAFVYRKFVFDKPKILNHLYIVLCGIGILLFNYGLDIYHTITAILVSYLFINVLNGSVLIAATFLFHMGYLLTGYYFTGTDSYDIKWTMPHCVLVLRLIALSFDVSDGQRPESELSVQLKKSNIKKIPNLLEIFSFTLFPASVLVGPQFSYRRFDSFMNKDFQKYTKCLEHGLRRGGIGLLYLLMSQVGALVISDNYILSEEYANRNIFYKWIIIGLWGKIALYKYISCWLLSEGVATCFGLTFVGVKKDDASGKEVEDWSGCENIKLATFENAEKFQDYIDAFNVNTNHWVAEYIYKRLKFLGNRYYSHGAALLFLAIWHGFHSGYYVCFLMEFIVMNFEKNIQSVLSRNEQFLNLIGKPLVSIGVYVLLKFYTLVGMGWCLVPFVFLKAWKWWPVYKTLWYYGFILYVPFPIYKYLLKQIFPSSLSNKSKDN